MFTRIFNHGHFIKVKIYIFDIMITKNSKT